MSILERPWDSDLRRVLADELLEKGDPQGELVNLAMLVHDELEQHGDAEALSDEGRARVRRCEELLFEHEEKWSAPILELDGVRDRPTCFATMWRRGYEYARGFPEVLRCERKVDPAVVEAFARATPLASIVVLMADAACVENLARCPSVSRLRHLTLSLSGPVDVTELLSRATRLESLFISGLLKEESLRALPSTLVALDLPASAAVLEELPRLRLRRLRLRGALSATMVKKLASGLGSVRALGLFGGEIGPKGLDAVLGALDPKALLSLELPGNKLRETGAQRLARGPFSSLRVLDLGGANQLGEGLRAVFSADLPELRVLRLGGGKLQAGALVARPGLRALDLSQAKLGAEAEGLGALAFPDLEHLGLEGCGLDADGVEALAKGPLLRTVKRLELGHNKFQNGGGHALAKTERLALEYLGLGHNWLGVKALTAMLEREDMRGLRSFRTGMNNFGTAASRVFAQGRHTALEDASLELDDDTAVDLAGAKSLSSLRRLNVSGGIGPRGAAALATMKQLRDVGFTFCTTATEEDLLRKAFGRHVWFWPDRRQE